MFKAHLVFLIFYLYRNTSLNSLGSTIFHSIITVPCKLISVKKIYIWCIECSAHWTYVYSIFPKLSLVETLIDMKKHSFVSLYALRDICCFYTAGERHVPVCWWIQRSCACVNAESATFASQGSTGNLSCASHKVFCWSSYITINAYKVFWWSTYITLTSCTLLYKSFALVILRYFILCQQPFLLG